MRIVTDDLNYWQKAAKRQIRREQLIDSIIQFGCMLIGFTFFCLIVFVMLSLA